MFRLLTGATYVALLTSLAVAQDAFEDNDTCETAAIVGSGTFQDLDVQDADPDWYEIDVPFGETVTIDILFTHADGPLDLFLYTDCASFIPDAFAVSSNDDETITFTNMTPSPVVYVTVFTSNENGLNTYDLVVDAPAGPACLCELDEDASGVAIGDLLAYLALWFADDAAADVDGTPGVAIGDLLAFLACWFEASATGTCP